MLQFSSNTFHFTVQTLSSGQVGGFCNDFEKNHSNQFHIRWMDALLFAEGEIKLQSFCVTCWSKGMILTSGVRGPRFKPG